MHKVLEKLKEEFLAMLPPTIYFFVMLHIIAIIRSLMVKAGQFEPSSTVSIAVAALILGKAVLDRRHASVDHRFPPVAGRLTVARLRDRTEPKCSSCRS